MRREMTASLRALHVQMPAFPPDLHGEESEMPTSPFLEPAGWNINLWEPSSELVAEGIPTNGFLAQSTMLIGFDSSSGSFSLQWLDQDEAPCSVSGLQPSPPNDPDASTLLGENLPVRFGDDTRICNLLLSLSMTDPKTLACQIAVSGSGFPETGTGTFTATANGGGN